MANESVLGIFNLNDEMERYSPSETSAGRRAETLIKNDRLRIVLVTMRSGIDLHEHSAPGPISIHALRGRFLVRFDGQEQEINPGGLISLSEGVRHSVHAIEDGAFLLTIGWAVDNVAAPS